MLQTFWYMYSVLDLWLKPLSANMDLSKNKRYKSISETQGWKGWNHPNFEYL